MRFSGRNCYVCILAAAAVVTAVALAADTHERILFVDPPLRVLTQCEFESARPGELQCSRDGWSRPVPLAARVTVWRGADYQGTGALRRGDILDIRLGIDPASGREEAQFIWANLVKVEGVIRYAGRGWLQVSPLIPGTIGELAPEAVYVRIPADAQSVPSGRRALLASLRPGQPVVVIGLRTGHNRVQASRLFAVPAAAN